MPQSNGKGVARGRLARIRWDDNELAGGDDDELRTVLENARATPAGSLGKGQSPEVAPLLRPPLASSSRSGHDRLRPCDEANADLCETRHTQELRDDFFALYTSQANAASSNHRLSRGDITASAAGASVKAAVGASGQDRASLRDQEDDEGADRDSDVDVDCEARVGRTDGHHAQQSQYVPESTEDLEEEDGIANATESPLASEQLADVFETETQQPPSLSDTTAITERTWQAAYWPHPHPPPFSARPRSCQTRVSFHTQRYGAFIKAYLGLSDVEVEQAQRRGRGICMIGVRKAPSSSSHLGSSASAAAVATRYTYQPTLHRRSHHGFGEPVKVQRTFPRHSVLAVEGDAVFSELIDRAEVLYAVEQHRLDTAWKAYAESTGAGGEDAAAAAATAARGSPAHLSLYPQFRKLPRVTEPYLRPNARCIALHYGLPDRTASDDDQRSAGRASTDAMAVKSEGDDNEAREPQTRQACGASARQTPFPRASLMAVVCTTRLEEGEEIYVSLESYYRCLDEVSWYRRCYSELNKRCGCSDGADVPCTGASAYASAGQDDLVGNVYTGVKRFHEWPADCAYYHGVGKRHASRVAEAAFPFTLVALSPAPELGDNQKGVVASAWLPYGTCLLYCGPSVATRKVELLVSERALRGDGAFDPTTAAAAKHNAQTHSAAEEDEDLSFVTDDTYALGLGRHGVCFGQGLTRYINHRYNISRFGNVELCSVILSVPSEFAGARGTATAAPPASTVSASADGTEAPQSASERLPPKTTGIHATPSRKTEEGAQVACAVAAKRPYHRRRARRTKKETKVLVAEVNGAAAAIPAPKVDGGLATSGAKPKRRPPRRRAQCRFLEERSFFVTVPFFLVTTDIPPGTSLLAWTYGEDYDAKLERQAVAEGHLVPYADAVLLNRRLAAPTAASTSSPATGCRFQRYSGDYRFAVSVGDVVWRRRPVRVGSSPAPVSCAGGGGIADMSVPPPEDDLFVVVQTLRSSVERVLLRPLQRIPFTSRQLGTLLREQHLDDYVSPHNPSNALLDLQKGPRPIGRPPSANSKRQRAAALAYDWTAHWAVFRLTDISALAPASFTAASPCFTPHTLSRYEEALRTCVVATIDSVGLLLVDIDYSTVHRTQDTTGKADVAGAASRMAENLQGSTTRVSSNGSRGCNSKQNAGRGAEGEAHRLILVNLDDLHHATSLVRTSPERATAVPALCNGLLWPLYCRSSKSCTAASTAVGASEDSLRARPGSRV